MHRAPRRPGGFVPLLLLCAPALAHAGEIPPDRFLQPYEPISLGYTKDSDDVPFIDINLSLKLRLFGCRFAAPAYVPRPYFGLSERFGFYLQTRQNSPVVQKSYKPLLLARWWNTAEGANRPVCDPESDEDHQPQGYVDFALAHQSNGQPIHDKAEYDAFANALSVANQGQYVDDYIHRGWDMLELTRRSNNLPAWGSDQYYTVADFKFFLPVGPFQGAEDEFHPDWETNPQGKPRRAVDGLHGFAEYRFNAQEKCKGAGWVPDLRCTHLDADYTTGYLTPFKYSTVRLAAENIHLGPVPLGFWIRSGYMSNLSMYYVKVSSVGVEVQIPADAW